VKKNKDIEIIRISLCINFRKPRVGETGEKMEEVVQCYNTGITSIVIFTILVFPVL
jgi:hypothetical protein